MIDALPRVLVVGCGPHATETLVPALASLGRAQLVGFCDIVLSRANDLAHRFHVSAKGTSPHQMIDELRPDTVILAGTPFMHVEVALHAFSAGAHVLVEKPAAISTAKLKELIAAAESSERVGMVGHNLRHTVAWRRAMEQIADTNIESITIEYHASGPVGSRWELPPHEAFVLSHAVHTFDLLNFVLGPPAATTHNLRSVDDGRFVLSTQWRSQRGVVGSATVSTCAPRFDWTVHIVTADACLIRVVSASEVVLQCTRTAGPWGAGQRSVWRSRLLDSGFDSAGYGAELNHFFDCIEGRSIASPSFADELPVYQALDDLYQQTGLARGSA